MQKVNTDMVSKFFAFDLVDRHCINDYCLLYCLVISRIGGKAQKLACPVEALVIVRNEQPLGMLVQPGDAPLLCINEQTLQEE